MITVIKLKKVSAEDENGLINKSNGRRYSKP